MMAETAFALDAREREMAEVQFGFAAFGDGNFELIVRNEKGDETTLYGQLRPGQLVDVDRILPTCVYVTGEPLHQQSE